MRTAFLIDGFNFYHSIKHLPRHLRWFDYDAYCRHFMRFEDELHRIIYFTALATWQPEAMARHQTFIDACKVNNIDVVLGKFKAKSKICPHCRQPILYHEEKATDVNIALHSYRLAAQREVKQIFLVTGDTDLIPAVKMIKEDFPSTRIGVIFPFNRLSRELKYEAHFSHTTTQDILSNFQLPDVIVKSNGKRITRPSSWI